MNALLHPQAAQELIAGATFYSQEATVELGRAFLAEFERSIGLLKDHPRIGAVWRADIRRPPMRRFPFNIVYKIQAEEIRVLAVAHQRRRPGFWRARV